MIPTQRNALLTRDAVMKLLTDDEVARVSTSEVTTALEAGTQYLDLEHMDLGIQSANEGTPPRMASVVARGVVSEKTWNSILGQLPQSLRR